MLHILKLDCIRTARKQNVRFIVIDSVICSECSTVPHRLQVYNMAEGG
jgi:hypothetical protein